jgi:hypothetical protein
MGNYGRSSLPFGGISTLRSRCRQPDDRIVILFIVSGPSHGHNFSMSQGPEDDLLPWVVGGVLLIAMTIAVAAVAGSGGGQAAPAGVETTDLRAKDSMSDPIRAATPTLPR